MLLNAAMPARMRPRYRNDGIPHLIVSSSSARLAILSNGSPEMLEAAVKSAALDQVLDDIYSVDTRHGASRPIRRSTTWLPPAGGSIPVRYPSSRPIAGTSPAPTKFGFRTVWINRTNQPEEYRDFPPALILPSLEGLVTGG